MKKKIIFQAICDWYNKLLHSRELLELGRRKSTDFTRNRIMPFTDLILFMVNLVRGTTQVALNRFFHEIKGTEAHMSQQAFSKARMKLTWEVFRYQFDKVVEQYYSLDSDYARWHGYRVCAVDGSKQQLPSDPLLREIYGTYGRGETAVTAQGSTLYDVLNDIIIDARLEPISIDERSLALEHVKHLRTLMSFSHELVIFDRGYASFELIKDFIQNEKPINFLFRLRTKFNVKIDQLPIGGDHKPPHNGQFQIKITI